MRRALRLARALPRAGVAVVCGVVAAGLVAWQLGGFAVCAGVVVGVGHLVDAWRGEL